ncbi:Sodium-dependent glucose transporter 1 [Schistosoma japonicum]|uniref:Sodium-dependent glucose transporter 1 n=1 Tax=Schistosoma japonicum TaxID=6182 RepID=A0A4Z2CR48_SCHJA|nr:Sodium-dependent glucose transporter 1 [Schistosoma japonicum]
MKKSKGILHSIHFHKVFHAKLAKTSVLCYAWISLGLYSEVLGPTLPTLMHNTNSDYDQIGMALSTRAIGLLFGSLIGGFLSDRYKALRAIFIMISLGVGAITTLIIPWCTNVIILTIVLFIAGLSHGFLTTNGNPLLASIWEEKAAGPFSLMHSGYGMGAAIAPLLAKPFTISFNSSINNHSIVSNGTNSTELVLVNAVIPYSIIAGIILFNVLYFLFIVCIDHSTSLRYNGITSVKSNDKITSSLNEIKKKKLLKLFFSKFITLLHNNNNNNIKCSNINKSFILIVCCTFITFFSIVGNERVFGKFMFTYALYGPIQLSSTDSYLINLIYWLCFCFARIFIFFISLILSSSIILLLLSIGTLCSSIGLCLLPYKKLWFYLCTILFSLFKSPLFPVTLACINHSYEITGFLVIIINFGSSFGATLLQFTVGQLIHYYGQIVFPYLVTATSCLLVITVILLIIGLKYIGNRFQHVNNNMIIDAISYSINDNTTQQ